MRYQVLATDYDATLACEGIVAKSTTAALQRLRDSGRLLVLVTGRELEELLAIFSDVHLFDRIVAENGALLYDPTTQQMHTLAEQPPAVFAETLRRRKVTPLSVGHVIVATLEPHAGIVLETIRDLGLGLEVIFNKESVMVLPIGVNKATGLTGALADLGLSFQEVVGIGDAENDHAFLAQCGYAAAVQNALPAIKEEVDAVMPGQFGRGVEQLIDRLIATDLAEPPAA